MPNTLRRFTLPLVLILVVLWANRLMGRTAKVTLQNGQEVTGEVVSENADSIVLIISGIRTPLKKSDIKGIVDVKSIEEQYAQKRGAIADTDVDARYNLADWLYRNNALDLAKSELDDLVKRAPDNAQVSLLRRAVEQAIKLRETPVAATHPSGGPSRPPAGQETPPGEAGKIVGNRLSEEQVNLMKVYLVDLDKKPGIYVPSEVLDKVFKDYAQDPDVPSDRDSQNKIRGMEGYDQLKFLFRIKTAAQYAKVGLYQKIRIKDDPPTIVSFRGFHSAYIVGYCATADCHGGPQGGPLILFRDRPNDADTVYTNLWILLQYANRTGIMIDFEKPDLSLLIQEGMAQANAAIRHPLAPTAPKWQSVIGNDKDDKYKLLYNWIVDNKDLLRPMKGLPMTFKLPVPGTKATTQPAAPGQPR